MTREPKTAQPREQDRRRARHRAVALWLLLSCLLAGLGAAAVAAVRTMCAARAANAVLTDSLMATPEAVSHLREAIRMRPDVAESWRLGAERMAPQDPEEALRMARHAVSLSGSSWQAWRTLALIEFQLGKVREAKADLRQAQRFSHSFEAHYLLGNMDLATGDADGFWRAMRAGFALVPVKQAPALVQQCLHASVGNPAPVLALLPHNRPAVEGAALDEVLARGHLQAALQIWQQMDCRSDQAAICLPRGLALVSTLLQQLASPRAGSASPVRNRRTSQAVEGRAIWNQLVQRGFLAQPAAAVGKITNGDFHFRWVGGGFGWLINPDANFLLAPAARLGNAAQFSFDGSEADRMWLMQQWISAVPGGSYELSFASQRLDGDAAGGVMLEVSTAQGEPLAVSPVRLQSSWSTNTIKLTIPEDADLILLRFFYQRPAGESRLHGTIQLAQAALSRP